MCLKSNYDGMQSGGCMKFDAMGRLVHVLRFYGSFAMLFCTAKLGSWNKEQHGLMQGKRSGAKGTDNVAKEAFSNGRTSPKRHSGRKVRMM